MLRLSTVQFARLAIWFGVEFPMYAVPVSPKIMSECLRAYM